MKRFTEGKRRKRHSGFNEDENTTEDHKMPKSNPTATAVITITALVLTNAFAISQALALPIGF